MRNFRFLAIVTLLLPTVAQAQFYYSPYTPAPTVGVSRASFVEMVMARAGSLQGGTNCFTDVKTQTFAPAVCAAKAMGIVMGDANGMFRPNDAISFVEAVAVAIRATGAAVPYNNPWYKGYITLLSDWNAFPHSVTNILYPITSVQAQELIISVFSADHRSNSGNNSSNNTGSGSDGDNNDDVHLTVTSSRSSADVGDIVTYTIKVRNEENHDLNNLDVRAYIDKDFDYVSSSDNGDYENDRVEWEIDIDEDETEIITLKLRVSGGADDGDKLALRVRVDDSEVRRTLTVDEDSDNDDDLRISITDSPSSVEAGDVVIYTIRLENRDDDDVRVDVRAFLDDDMIFLSASHGGDEDDDEVEWDNVYIDDNDDEVITLRVRIRSGVRDGDTVRLRVTAGGEEDTETTQIED